MEESRGMQRELGELSAEVRNLNKRLDHQQSQLEDLIEAVESINKDRWGARAILLALGGGVTLVVTKAGAIMMALGK